MTTPELESRTLWWGGVLVAALSLAGGVAGGASVALGVAGGGAIALLNFRWLCRDVMRVTRALTVGGLARWRLGSAVLRQLGTLGALGGLMLSDAVNPAWVAVGLAALPPTLLIQGLRGPSAALPAADAADR
jgi:hypothetical protein